MRVVKDADKRRCEIIDAAEELFITQGFESTSTNEILEKVNIARGTLYYHFKSKEEILDAVIDRMINASISKASEIVKNEDIPFMNRLTAVIASLKMPQNDIMEHIHRPQNALMHQKVQRKLIDGIVPVISEWCEEGIHLGLLDVEHTSVAAEMLTLYSAVMFDDDIDQSDKQKLERINGFIYHAERMLGAQPGVIAKALADIFEQNGDPR